MLMDAVLDYLRQNPLIALALLIVAVAIVLTLVKKLFKVAVVLLVVFLVAGGTVFQVSKQDVLDAGEKALREGKKLGREAVEKGREVYREQIAPSDTARPLGTPDTLRPDRAKRRAHRK
jgi:hypothetical protein